MPASTGPQIEIVFDDVPSSLHAPTRLRARLVRVIPGPDRPDYCLVLLNDALWLAVRPDDLRAHGLDPAVLDPDMVRPGPDDVLNVQVWALAICTAWVGTPFTPGMREVPTQVALVLDNRVLRESALNLAAVWPIGMATTTELAGGET